jgi:hypothetical protein
MYLQNKCHEHAAVIPRNLFTQALTMKRIGNKPNTTSFALEADKRINMFCKVSHDLIYCDDFLNVDLEKRRNFLRETRLWFSCYV